MSNRVELIVGVVGRAHGIAGELIVSSRTDEVERRFAPGSVLHAEGEPHRHWQVLSHRDHSGRLLVRLDGVNDRNAAEALGGTRLAVTVDADERPADAEEFYDHQLLGLRVIDHRGEPVGSVVEVLHLSHQDVLAIEPLTGTEPVLVPFVAAVVPVVDLGKGVIGLAELDGLLPAADEPEPAT